MRSLIPILPLVLGLAACQSVEEKHLEVHGAPHTPLEHDPTHSFELATWWSNGKQLLRLSRPEELGGYAIYGDTNRYHAPVEVGRCHRDSYAVLWLDPYEVIGRENVRVAIDRRDGRLSLTVPDLAPMFALDGPPEVMEDRVAGRWQGPMGGLVLGGALSYHFSPARGDEGVVAVAGHDGTWAIVNDVLVLQPDVPGSEPILMPLIVGDKDVSLDAPGGALTRVDVMTRSPAPSATP